MMMVSYVCDCSVLFSVPGRVRQLIEENYSLKGCEEWFDKIKKGADAMRIHMMFCVFFAKWTSPFKDNHIFIVSCGGMPLTRARLRHFYRMFNVIFRKE